jgi:hypothetical protein
MTKVASGYGPDHCVNIVKKVMTLPSECVSLNRPVLGDFHSSPSLSLRW